MLVSIGGNPGAIVFVRSLDFVVAWHIFYLLPMFIDGHWGADLPAFVDIGIAVASSGNVTRLVL